VSFDLPLFFGFLGIGAVLCASIALTATRTVPRMLAIWRGPKQQPKIALTIDDGPTPTTPALLDALHAHGVPASFFCIGTRLEQQEAIARRVLAEGHELCNHTYSHSRRFAMKGEIFARDELMKGDRVLQRMGACEQSRRYARAVAGIVSPPVGRAAKLLGMKLVHWTASARDGGPIVVPVPAALKRLERGLVPGGILVIHDRPGQKTAELIGPLADAAKARGLTFVALSELLDLYA
jgi:peptidoglycan-N-acetylglucosamine deacetylase